MDKGNGSWNVVEVTVTRTDCAARYEVPSWLEASVRISNANHSAATMIMPGRASRIMGPRATRITLASLIQYYCGHSDNAVSAKSLKETYPSWSALAC